LREPNGILVFDTETTIDRTQSLTFGAYRLYTGPLDALHLVDEGLFYADDLPTTDPKGMAELRRYVATHDSARGHDWRQPLRLLSREEFVESVFFGSAYRGRDRIVGFNLPFDLSRLAVEVGEARSEARGGFSLILSRGRNGHRERKHRPRVTIRQLDSKRAFISFTKPLRPDRVDRIPEESLDFEADDHYVWRGRFLDLKTLAFALTAESHSLQSACEAFGLLGKDSVEGHGVITESYIDYCRQDVAATTELYKALMAEFNRHPIALAPERAYSSASIAKAYLAAMGVQPFLERQPDFSPEALGIAMCSFYGGRAECRIRRLSVPVALVDFTSMYPSVGALMNLRRFHTAARIDVEEATEEVAQLLSRVSLEGSFDRDFWPGLVGFALVVPDGDILPVRAAYDGVTYGIGVNPVFSDEPLWYSIPDLVASVLLTDKVPRVLRAIRLVAVGRLESLQRALLRGAIEMNPSRSDVFVAMVEERQRIKQRTDLPSNERDRLSDSTKIVANSGSYGIFSEFNPADLGAGKSELVTVYGRKEAFKDRVTAPEEPGSYCFPPIAACITGAARLMLSMLECCVTDHGGSWAFCDTDSMAIVADEASGTIACPGGEETGLHAESSIRALSLDEVDAIRQRFNCLSPYDPEIVPDLLKLEEVATCFAVSAKRYSLFHLENGMPVLLSGEHGVSEHGLGQLLNPVDEDADDRSWIRILWKYLLCRELGLPAERPDWFDRVTVTRTTVSSPLVLRAFAQINGDSDYREQIKPFSFLLSASGTIPPAAVGNESFRLVAPWESDPTKWLALPWVDLHHPSAGVCPATTAYGVPGFARMEIFGDVADRYGRHPEMKSIGPEGEECGRDTVGLLRRRPVTVGAIRLIGKEANQLEDRTAGLIEERDIHLSAYNDGDAWHRIVLPRLVELGSVKVAEAVGLSERRARDILKGRAMPHHQTRRKLEALVVGR
jgi:hypothetical protein